MDENCWEKQKVTNESIEPYLYGILCIGVRIFAYFIKEVLTQSWNDALLSHSCSSHHGV